MIALVSSPAKRLTLALPDGRTALLVRHGPMTLYAHGAEVRYGPETEVVMRPAPRPGQTRSRSSPTPSAPAQCAQQ